MLWALALLAPVSLIASGLPGGAAWPLAVLAAGWGIRDARRHARQPVRSLVIPTGQSAATCDGERMEAMAVAWRGPLAFVSWRGEGGVMHRLSFWPDTLDPGMRRELRLAMMRRQAATDTGSVAG